MALLASQVQLLRPIVLFRATEASHVFSCDCLNRGSARANQQYGCREHHEFTQGQHSLAPQANRIGASDIDFHEQATSFEQSRAVVQGGEGKFTTYWAQWYYRTQGPCSQVPLDASVGWGSLRNGDGATTWNREAPHDRFDGQVPKHGS